MTDNTYQRQRCKLLLAEFYLHAEILELELDGTAWQMSIKDVNDQEVASARSTELDVLIVAANDWIRDVYSKELVDWN